jgi:hypothetical protein
MFVVRLEVVCFLSFGFLSFQFFTRLAAVFAVDVYGFGFALNGSI